MCNVDGQFHTVIDRADDLFQENVDVLLRITGGNPKRLDGELVTQSTCKQRQAVLLRLGGAEGQYPIRTILFRQQLEQGHGRERRLGLSTSEGIASQFRIRPEHG